jgi:glycosyltransferase involved in cell wall biosynthesis
LNLLNEMIQRGFTVDLVLASARGQLLSQLHKDTRLFDLGAGRVTKAILPLAAYLRRERPAVLISHMGHANLAAITARTLAFAKTQLVLVEHIPVSAYQNDLKRDRLIPFLARRLYPRSDALVAVSHEVARDLEARLGLRDGTVKVIYNAVVSDDLLVKARAPVSHHWLLDGSVPVVLATGRLVPQKNFIALIEAFKILRKSRPARLIILGEGKLRSSLETLVSKLGLADDVLMPGFVENPYSFMTRASVFVLSSLYEGLPTVLVEAMVCGCPVVATDCSGPREIIEQGIDGMLVPVGNVEALAAAMIRLISDAEECQRLASRAKQVSEQFRVATIVAAWEDLLKQLAQNRR